MRLGILSDTHDRLARTRVAVDILRAEGAEVLIHCGDVTWRDVVPICAVLPCYYVFGNNDSDTVPALRKAIDEAPKSTRWKLRARVGERQIWYQEPEEMGHN